MARTLRGSCAKQPSCVEAVQAILLKNKENKNINQATAGTLIYDFDET
jgi:hypothetical protein